MLKYTIVIITFLTITMGNAQALFDVYFPPKGLPPIFYTDEVLPICISGPANTSLGVKVLIVNFNGEPIYAFTPEKSITGSNSTYCCEITDFPPLKGFFSVEIEITHIGTSNSWKIPICRIERFTPESRSIFSLKNPNPKFTPLSRLYWFDEVLFPADEPQIQTLVQDSVNQGINVCVEFDPGKFQSPTDTLEHLITQIGGYVTKWNFKTPQDKSLLDKLFQLIISSLKTSTVSLSVDSMEDFQYIENFIANINNLEIEWCGELDLNVIQTLIEKIIEMRNEIPKISISLTGDNLPPTFPEKFQKIWELLTLTPSKINIPYELLFQDDSPTPLIPFIIGVSKLWNTNFEFTGWYNDEPSSKACVFSTPEHWLLVYWGDQSLTLKGDTLATTQGYDIYTNPISLPSITNGGLTIECQTMPSYLTGTCYEILADASQNTIKTLSERILSNEISNLLPSSAIDDIKAIVQKPRDLQNRIRLLNIIRSLPQIEKNIITNPDWSKRGAIFTFYLYNFLKKNSILEQTKGEPFREPFLDIKTRCEEYITIFLTGSSTTLEKDKRANLIMKEVNKFLELADKSASNGKRIEATALLYIAEGMALSLIEHLKTTPLMLAEDKLTKRDHISQSAGIKTSQPPAKEGTPPNELGKDNYYTVTTGDSPEKIAKKFGISTKELLITNNLTERSTIRPGQKLRIPSQNVVPGSQPSQDKEISSNQSIEEKVATETPPSTNEEKDSILPKDASQTEEIIIYKIQPGDIPATIAKKFQLTPEELMKFNNITDPTKLRVGQELKIPVSKTKAIEKTSPSSEEVEGSKDNQEMEKKSPDVEAESIIHIVQKGDNPYVLSKKYGVPIEDILKANNLTPKSILQIGQKLIIPKAKKQ